MQYFDCLLPELRYQNYTVWKYVMIAYKIVLPTFFLTIYLYCFEDLCPFVRVEALCNFLLILFGFENGIAAISWLLCEMISVYSVFLSLLQYYILLTEKTERELNPQCEASQAGLISQFSAINDVIFIFTAGFNIRIVLPVLTVLLLISILTCSCKVVLKIFRRDGLNSQMKLKVDKFTQQPSTITCSICLEDLQLNEEVCQLPCKHWFHYTCLQGWYQNNRTCPNCRQDIQSESFIS